MELESVGEDFDEVLGLPTGPVLDLLAAGCALADDQGFLATRPDSGK